MPIEVAAAELQRLYLILAVSAFTSQYGSLAPSNVVVLHFGWVHSRIFVDVCRSERNRIGGLVASEGLELSCTRGVRLLVP